MIDTAKKDLYAKKPYPDFLVKIVVSQFRKLKMWVYEDAQLQAGKIGVVILSHGLAGHCNGYSTLARDLAQNGYIVICPEHLEGIRNIYPTNEENRVYRQVQLKERQYTYSPIMIDLRPSAISQIYSMILRGWRRYQELILPSIIVMFQSLVIHLVDLLPS